MTSFSTSKLKCKRSLLWSVLVATFVAALIYLSKQQDFFSTDPILFAEVEQSREVEQPKKNKQRADVVIVLSMIRSGSSLVGSIFNEQENVFYLYEPLFSFGNQECNEETRTSSLQVLRNITSCQFENLHRLYQTSTRNDGSARCKVFHVCFAHEPRKASRFLSRDLYICKLDKEKHVCPKPLNPDRLNQHCKQRLVALKVNYLCELEWILSLLDDERLSVKIVHLVRDPRSTVYSRIHVGRKNVINESREVCDRLKKNLIFSETILNSPALRSKYMRIRFEDFVLNPVGKTLQIYDFSGIEMNMHIKLWLDNVTSGKNDKKLSKTQPFGLKRNFLSVLNEWRTELSFENVAQIQTQCQFSLKKLEYKIYSNITEQQKLENLHFVPIW